MFPNGVHDVRRDKYTITGIVDWERIIRETRLGQKDGAEVVRVTPVTGKIQPVYCFGKDPYVVAKYPLRYLDSFTGLPIFSKYYCGWMEAENVLSDADIEAAIREHHKADKSCDDCANKLVAPCWGCSERNHWIPKANASKSAHKKGERFEGEVFGDIPTGHHLVYAGEIKHTSLQNKRWHVYEETAYHGWSLHPREILTLVPDEPEPKYTAGQWIWCDKDYKNHLFQASNEDAHALNNCKLKDFRPAVPADFERTVVKTVRAYETRSSSIILKWSDGTYYEVSNDTATELGYPIIPLSVSNGVFEAPK
jgi:hypothetical protein